jgi:type I restriction enzyme S subunit
MVTEFQQHEVANLISSGKLMINDGYRAKNSELSREGIPFARAGNIDGGFHFEDADRVPSDTLVKVGQKRSRAGDVVFTSKGTVGRFAFVRDQTPEFVYSPQLCFWRSIDKSTIDPRWLFYWMNGREFFLQFKGVAGQTDMAEYVSLRDQRAMKMTLPPLAEQKRIAEVLGALDDKIELNRRMNATLEATARALFQSWFVDFDPVRAKLDLPAGQAGGRTPSGIDPATTALFPDHLKESSIGKKPIGWEVTTLETALSVLEVGGRPKGGVGGITSGIPSIGAESIVGVGQFDFAKTKYVPVEFYEGMKKGHIQSHDVLLYKDGGRPGEYEPHVSMFGDGFPFEKCSINEHVYRLRTNDRLSQEYLYFWLTSEMVLAEMRVKGTGVAIPGLNSTAVRSLTTLVPPKPIVEAFTKQAAPLVSCILANAKQSRTLATLRDTLLPKLLNGEYKLETANT